jgi:hypothetical protein
MADGNEIQQKSNSLTEELFLLQRAARCCWWRWRSEEKRLRNKGVVNTFELHLRELHFLSRAWREVRQDAGLTHIYQELPPAAKRVYLRVAWRKCQEYLHSHPT